MTEKWAGKVAVITGTSAGIGAALFKDFANAGIITIGLARRAEKVEDLIKELGGDVKAYAYKCDVSSPESVTETFKAIEEKFGVVHILVNNAGVGRSTSIFDESPEAFRKMNEILDTNVRGLAHCSREAFRLMKKSDDYGMIININSVIGHQLPFTGFSMSMYGASKYAVTALTETMRQEMLIQENSKIRMSSVSPGYVNTEFVVAAGFVPDSTTVLEGFPYLVGDDVSKAVMYLLSTPYNVNVTELTIRPVGEKF
ncbi:farnesol dehydrogenase-like [Chironomus tepperi]|uniref:farnesol dehydrogenase-like n=1 Tax=Chironomus tepperi TaxID=113505 RepID=UPI00391F811D